MNNVKHVDKMGPLHKKTTKKHWCTHQGLMTLISLNILNRMCSAFAKKAWHMMTEWVAMHDHTEKMIKLVCFFTLHADSLAGFMIQSLLGQTFLFSDLKLFYEVYIQRRA